MNLFLVFIVFFSTYGWAWKLFKHKWFRNKGFALFLLRYSNGRSDTRIDKVPKKGIWRFSDEPGDSVILSSPSFYDSTGFPVYILKQKYTKVIKFDDESFKPTEEARQLGIYAEEMHELGVLEGQKLNKTEGRFMQILLIVVIIGVAISAIGLYFSFSNGELIKGFAGQALAAYNSYTATGLGGTLTPGAP